MIDVMQYVCEFCFYLMLAIASVVMAAGLVYALVLVIRELLNR